MTVHMIVGYLSKITHTFESPQNFCEAKEKSWKFQRTWNYVEGIKIFMLYDFTHFFLIN